MCCVAWLLLNSYELTQSPEKVWGGPDENGDWNGMLGMLQREEVEFAVGPFTVTPQRETVSDLTYPLSGADKAILLARPKLDTDMAGFVKAFTYEVMRGKQAVLRWLVFSILLIVSVWPNFQTWLLTLVFAIITAIVTTLLVRAENVLFGIPVEGLGSKVCLWVLKAFTQESSTWLPKNDAGRLLITTWLLASLVFMSSYSGILTAMLTLPRVVIPINSIYDMVAQTDIPWRLEAGSSMFQYFKEATDGVRREVFTGRSGTFQDCWAARQEIVNGEFAAICDIITMKKAMAWDFRSASPPCRSEWLPPHDAGRVLVTTWLLASLVFMSSYGGILTAMLTVPRVTIPIDSMYDLVAQNDMPWKVEGGSMLYQYFQEATEGARREVFLRSSGTFKDCWEARQDLADGKYAGFCDDVTMIKVMAWDFETSGSCNVYIAREKVISSVWKGVGFKRNSPYMSRVNDVILTLQQAGLVDIWLQEQIGTVPHCLRPPSTDRQDGISPLDMEAFGGPFLVLVGGKGVEEEMKKLQVMKGRPFH
ncbi:Glutamate receptor ionotropic, delta-1 [Portunus trituberculatus]|uniref:Glutamate receptor ionotropic, delta-1 n=1 Tax=Portunus trituberculatus TaxID=210409 RepID=A0A5B7DRY1_PORTR|nr:Glutamate receptor ionotropic, delta-1 [Portunus trituberculatus]